ncbi:flagellar biosynthesis protein FlhB [Alteromonas sp. a30]|uniref:flagellar biosynthesis protein FlhB n=1 Tax=Alteromonas sp. a30 TaxID=2730917 RepID=UPI0022818D33|nr:flagellar biosynthesis protein FlhB [Alteromonas sp. a30]MCY7294420.1 flagellar biosynthesis protein FlhB [Alteromonas sp. a30]
MAEDSHDKTEEPTSKRIEDARKKGQIARSRELGTALVLLFSAISIFILGRDIGKAVYNIMGRMFALSRDETYDYTHMFQAWGFALSEVAIPVISFLVITVIAGFYGSIALGGYNWSWESAKPKASKLSPIAGLKRMFGMNGIVELFKALAKFLIVGTITFSVLRFFSDEALHLDLELYPRNVYHALELIGWSFIIICCAMLPIAAFDVPYQSYKHNEQMKMTKQEVKDERKNAEGDPLVKSRIRKLQFQAAAKRMMQAVPEADVVVTNPTHYSIAIKYQDNGDRAPVVVAKGVDELAMHIRKIAEGNDVPMVASPALARAIYYSTELDHEIPEKLFMAVAQVLAYVFQLKKWKAGKGHRPKSLSTNLPIPPELRR